MHTLTHFRFCPFSRSIRVVLAEIGVEVALAEERPWEWRPQLLQLNPAGDLPVLALEGGPILCGHYPIVEYIAEEMKVRAGAAPGLPLLPGNREGRAEVRRLIAWFHGKLHAEAARTMIARKIWCHFEGASVGAPDTDELRALRANLRYHMGYVAWLADGRNWLAGDEISYADIAAAAQLSCLDYVGEVPWQEFPAAKLWYSRIKSRRSFAALLADRVPGQPPPKGYTDLDF